MRSGVSGLWPWSWRELVTHVELKLNRALIDRMPSQQALLSCWQSQPDPGQLPLELAATHATQTQIAFVITTYNRDESCARVVHDLAQQCSALSLTHAARVLVLDDASHAPYERTRAALDQWFPGRHIYARATHNQGKRHFWRTYQLAFQWLQQVRPEHALFVQDDLELTSTFVHDALSLWRGIDDPHKAVLSLLQSADDEPNGRWISFLRADVAGGALRLTQWFDLPAFVIGPQALDLLQHRVFAVHPNRWMRDPAASSGVGRQLTYRLWKRGNIYQVARSLAFHGAEPSQMNPEARADRPMDNRPR